MRTRSVLAVVAGALVSSIVAVGTPSQVGAVPAGFTDQLVATATQPTAIKVLPGGDLLVLEKQGALRRIGASGAMTDAGAVDVCSQGERGLLSAALDPTFATSGIIYLYATRPDAGGVCANRLSKFTLTGSGLSNEQVLVDNIAWSATNHNGGSVEVGRDGLLYLSVGEGADVDRAQDMSSLGGKVLRITTTGAPAPGNPFSSRAGAGRCARQGQTASVCQEIYALGLRNPFRMAFDPNSTTTRFRINDVGAQSWEEVDEGVRGANYGWPVREGSCERGQTSGCTPGPTAYREPLTSYRSGYIVGGAFVPDGWWGAGYDGAYLFADGGSDRMWSMNRDGTVNYAAPFASSELSVTTDLAFGVRGGQRALFYVNNGNGEVRKIVGPNAATNASAGPAYLGGAGGAGPTPGPSIPAAGGAQAYTARPAAQRVLDTRNAIGGPSGRVPGGAPRTVALGVPAGATAALVNITLDNGGTEQGVCRPGSYIVAWKPGTSKPATSNANVAPCDLSANSAVVQVDASGSIVIEVYEDVHVIIDVLGHYTPAAGAVAAGRFGAVTPSRLVDTRQPNTATNPHTRAHSGNTSVVRVPVAGRGGVPAGARTVSLTVTAIGTWSGAAGYVTAYAGGTTRPVASTVNHTGSGDVKANQALVPVGADGSIELYLYEVSDVVVDVGGWITSSADTPGTEGRLRLTSPTRIADSRVGIGMEQLGFGGQSTLDPVGVPSGATAIAQNVTMVGQAPGWICATPNPWSGGDVSIQNSGVPGQARPAMTFTTLGPGPQPRLRYCSYDVADLIVDVFGWYE